MKKTTASVLLLLAVSFILYSCAGEAVPTAAEKQTTGTAVQAETETEPENAEYPFGLEDMDGFQLDILNIEDIWNMYVSLDFESTSADALDTAVYSRNRMVEEKLNCIINECEESLDDLDGLNKIIKNNVLSGDDIYDVTYASIYQTPTLATDGCFIDLMNADGLHLDSPWWDQTVIQNVRVNNILYFASGAMHLMATDAAWCLFFNENMMESRNMEMPYQLVRDGKWTVDALLGYVQQAADLNGDAGFGWSPSGNCVYGISKHVNAPDKFIIGCGGYAVQPDEGGIPVFSADSERFLKILESLARVIDTTNGYSAETSTTDFDIEAGGYMHVFKSGRSMFLTAEIKGAQLLRDMDDTFGILPYPKYDESQPSYISSFVNQCLFYTIPKTNKHLHETAVISDVISYYSLRDVLPIYSQIVVEQKGLRNEDSIEMLQIIRNSQTVDVSLLFGWSNTMFSELRTMLSKGGGSFASTIEKQRSSIENSIQLTVEAIK